MPDRTPDRQIPERLLERVARNVLAADLGDKWDDAFPADRMRSTHLTEVALESAYPAIRAAVITEMRAKIEFERLASAQRGQEWLTGFNDGLDIALIAIDQEGAQDG